MIVFIIKKEETFQEIMWFVYGLWSASIVKDNPSILIERHLFSISNYIEWMET